MAVEDIIPELDIALLERKEWVEKGTPTKHALADITLGAFIGTATVSVETPVATNWSALITYQIANVKMDKQKNDSTNYEKKLKLEVTPLSTDAADPVTGKSKVKGRK